MAMSADILVVTVMGAKGIQWVEARDAVYHPKMHRTAPATKNYSAPNIKSAKAEKPRPN